LGIGIASAYSVRCRKGELSAQRIVEFAQRRTGQLPDTVIDPSDRDGADLLGLGL
jgi:hypothetical protein